MYIILYLDEIMFLIESINVSKNETRQQYKKIIQYVSTRNEEKEIQSLLMKWNFTLHVARMKTFASCIDVLLRGDKDKWIAKG